MQNTAFAMKKVQTALLSEHNVLSVHDENGTPAKRRQELDQGPNCGRALVSSNLADKAVRQGMCPLAPLLPETPLSTKSAPTWFGISSVFRDRICVATAGRNTYADRSDDGAEPTVFGLTRQTNITAALIAPMNHATLSAAGPTVA